MMNKYPEIRRVRRPEYNEKAPFLLGIWQFIVGTFLWLLFIVVAGITLYSHWFSQAFIVILQQFKNKPYYIPLWFSVLCTIFFFPITLLILLVSALIKIIKGN